MWLLATLAVERRVHEHRHARRNDTGDAGAAPPEPFDRLKSLLRRMIQPDRGGPDFGLCRIMAVKAGEIEEFPDRDLLPQVKAVLADVAEEEQAALKEALAAGAAVGGRS